MLNKVYKFLKNRVKPVMKWKGNFSTWEEAKEKSNGYAEDIILNKVIEASETVLKHENWFERDGTILKKHLINPQLLCSILYIATNDKIHDFNVLDFGGAFGSVYNQHKKYLINIDTITWNIIEQSHFYKVGKKKFETNVLRFFESINEYRKENTSTKILLLSGVLQYLDNPYQILNQLLELNPEYIIVDLTVLTNKLHEQDILTIQYINKQYYGKKISYPCWFFNRNRFLNFVIDRYEVIIDQEAYIGTIKYNNTKYHYSYLLLKKKEIDNSIL